LAILSLQKNGLMTSITKYSITLILLCALCLLFYVPGLRTLPPIDRDEARFAQATRQMLESGDFVQIRFQDEARNKKPIGIYWLQAAAVALSGTFESREIWPYRIPSLLGAIVAVLLTFALGRRLFDPQIALLGAMFCASSLLLVIEAHLATTDAVLLATVVTAQGALSQYYLRVGEDIPPGPGVFVAFWVAQAMGILIKGPITPMISLLTIGCLVAADREVKWLRGLKPLRGILIVAALISPWAVAIGLATGGAFFSDAIVGDLLSKAVGGMEAHGFPPGYYLLLMPVTLWPASLFAGIALVRVWKSRSVRAIRFCLAWIIPVWVLFEMVPTKLPHYVLPTYPAVSLLIAATIYAGGGKTTEPRSGLVRLGFVSCSLVLLVLGFGFFALPYFLDHHPTALSLLPITVAVITAGLAIWKFSKGLYVHSAGVAVIGTALVLGPGFQWVLPDVNSLWLSRSATGEARRCSPNPGSDVMLASAGYHEPSLVFLLGTHTRLTSPGQAARFLQNHPGGLALIGTKEEEEFQRELGLLRLSVTPISTVRGFCYSKGRNMSLRLYSVNSNSANGNALPSRFVPLSP
jgi:4-amino-4-deoxy-L-arabinose transferase-like glycosyltransferase